MDISVIVPFYRGNAYMERLFGCIRENAANAPDLTVELVLVNDSPDCPIVYEEAWVQGFSLKVFENPVNSGIQRSRVNGLAAASGAYIVFLDQDDLLDPQALVSQYQAIGSADIVLANGHCETPCGCVPIYRTAAQQCVATEPRFYYTVSNLITSPGQCMIRKLVIPQLWLDCCIGRNGSDDLLLWLLLFGCNARWTVNPLFLYTHKSTGHNLSDDIGKMVDSSQEVLAVLQRFELFTAKQTRQFVRSRRMAALYIGSSLPKKLLTLLLYPDVAWHRLMLHFATR